MKHLLFLLLLSAFSHAQQSYGNYTKVTAVRVVNDKDYGPCIVSGVVKQGPFVSNKLQAVQSDNEQLAYALLSLKKEAKTWEKKPLPCNAADGGRGVAVPNMFVVQVNRYRDTIFTTAGNAGLFFPEEDAEYIDATGKLNGLLDDNLCFFFERNYYDELISHKKDSVAVAQVLVNGKPIFGHSRKSFDKNIAKFQVIQTDSVFGSPLEVQQQFIINNLKIKFGPKRIAGITAVNIEYDFPQKIPFTVGGLQIGDAEEKLYAQYPCSTEFKNWGADIRDLNSSYYYEVQLMDDKGYVVFYIRKNRISEIEVAFRE